MSYTVVVEQSQPEPEIGTEIYRQTVESLDLVAVIKAVNGISRKRRASAKSKEKPS